MYRFREAWTIDRKATCTTLDVSASTVSYRSTTEERLDIVEVYPEVFGFFQLDVLTFILNSLVLQAEPPGHMLLQVFAVMQASVFYKLRKKIIRSCGICDTQQSLL